MVNNTPVSAGDVRDVGSISRVGRSSGLGNGNLTPTFLPEKFHAQRSLGGYSSWGRRVRHN